MRSWSAPGFKAVVGAAFSSSISDLVSNRQTRAKGNLCESSAWALRPAGADANRSHIEERHEGALRPIRSASLCALRQSGGCESVGGNTARGGVSVTRQVSGGGLSARGPVRWMPAPIRGAAGPVPPCQTALTGALRHSLAVDLALHTSEAGKALGRSGRAAMVPAVKLLF